VPRSQTSGEPLLFGGYELLEKVATGGMAEIYRARARRPGGVSKIVCLKRIHPTLCADPAFVDMFVEEARLGLGLTHSNIVPVFDFGCVDGYHFIVMEYVDGHDLADVVARSQIVTRPFPSELAVFVVSQVLEGLAYAHGRTDEEQRPLDLVHRDVSPSNVMISGAGEVKILDFGIARSALREFHTRTGVVKGKPGYMAPEQARGDALDARVDVYACGVILHELLTGSRPEVCSSGDGGPGALRVEIDDDDLSSIVEQALEQDPADRFESAAEMRDALHEVLSARSMRPRPAALASYVASLFVAPAAAPDWSHGSNGGGPLANLDRHLAALVPDDAPEQPPATESLRASPERASAPPTHGPATEAVGEPRAAEHVRAPRGRDRSFALGAALLALVLAGVGAAAYALWPGAAPAPRAPADPAVDRPPSGETPARVEVRTTPPGAAIALDGEALGSVTPSIFDVTDGSHRLDLDLEGFLPQTRIVEARAGQQVLVDTALAPAPGSLRITSEPTAAEVWVDGRFVGRTPFDLPGLDRAGTHRVEVRMARYGAWQRDVVFAGEQHLVVHAELVREARPSKAGPGTGYLSVVAHPWAEVLLDRQPIGVTPIIRRSVTAGRHQLVLRNGPRGFEERRVVNVPSDDEVRVSVDLTQPPP
jgi:serine/threonine protein kinase